MGQGLTDQYKVTVLPQCVENDRAHADKANQYECDQGAQFLFYGHMRGFPVSGDRTNAGGSVLTQSSVQKQGQQVIQEQASQGGWCQPGCVIDQKFALPCLL